MSTKYGSNADEKNKVIAELMRQAGLTSVDNTVYPAEGTVVPLTRAVTPQELTRTKAPAVTSVKNQSKHLYQAHPITTLDTQTKRTQPKTSYISYAYQSDGKQSNWMLNDNGYVTHGKGICPAFFENSWDMLDLIHLFMPTVGSFVPLSQIILYM